MVHEAVIDDGLFNVSYSVLIVNSMPTSEVQVLDGAERMARDSKI